MKNKGCSQENLKFKAKATGSHASPVIIWPNGQGALRNQSSGSPAVLAFYPLRAWGTVEEVGIDKATSFFGLPETTPFGTQ